MKWHRAAAGAEQPADGQECLCYFGPGQYGTGDYQVLEWNEEEAFNGREPWHDPGTGEPPEDPPTHWMALPEPPVE